MINHADSALDLQRASRKIIDDLLARLDADPITKLSALLAWLTNQFRALDERQLIDVQFGSRLTARHMQQIHSLSGRVIRGVIEQNPGTFTSKNPTETLFRQNSFEILAMELLMVLVAVKRAGLVALSPTARSFLTKLCYERYGHVYPPEPGAD